MGAKDKLRKTSKRESSPDKPETPNASQEALHEDGNVSERKVLINDEILALRIDPLELTKIQEEAAAAKDHRPTPPLRDVIVYRNRLDEPVKKAPLKTKNVVVAKLAPPDAQLKEQDYMANSGARFDKDGNIIPHSILGTVKEYKREAIRRGDLPKELFTPSVEEGCLSVAATSGRPSKTPSSGQRTRRSFAEMRETSALINWQQKMLDRQKQMGYLSGLLNMPEEMLVMNQADSYRQMQEQRELLDRTIHAVDNGKGGYDRCEFFRLQDKIGPVKSGIHITLTQAERGYPPPIEHVRVPRSIQKEKGIKWTTPRHGSIKPWHKSSYLQQRRMQLSRPMRELDPHEPDAADLEVIGSCRPHVTFASGMRDEDMDDIGKMDAEPYSARDTTGAGDVNYADPLRNFPDVYPEPISGPSLMFHGKPARWQAGGINGMSNEKIEARILFEAFATCRVTSHLEIANDGTTAIYYDWRKQPQTNPFDVMKAKVQRFYFNNGSGVMLPGDVMRFPFVFKSPNAGFFTEQWTLRTKPVLAGGATLLVTLRGVAVQEDKYAKQRMEIEKDLQHKEAQEIVSDLLSELLDGLGSGSLESSSPLVSDITERELFERHNPQLFYNRAIVNELKEIYDGIFPEEEGTNYQPWNLDVESIRKSIVALPMEETDDRQQELLSQLNSRITAVSFPPYVPIEEQMYAVGWELLCNLADDIVSQSVHLRRALGLTERHADDTTAATISGLEDESKPQPPTRQSIYDKPSEGKKSKAAKAEAREAKKSAREDKRARQSAVKESLAAKGGKSSSSSRRSQDPTCISPDDILSTRQQGGGSSVGGEVMTVHDTAYNPLQEANYLQKIHTQAYLLVDEALDKIGYAFEEIEINEKNLERPGDKACK